MTDDDVVVLNELERQVSPAAAKEFERFIRQQHRAERNFRRRETVEMDLGVDLDLAIATSRTQRAHRGDRRRARAH